MESRKQISGSGSIAWVSQNPKRNIAAAGVLLIESPDRLRLEVQDPLGNILALLVVNGDRLWWFSNEEKAITMARGNGLAQLLAFPITGAEFVRAWLARPSLDGFAWSDEGEGETVFARTHRGRTERLVWLNRTEEPEQWVRAYSANSELRVDYDDYAMHGGVEFPETVRITVLIDGKEENSLLWNWRDWRATVPDRPELFQIPQPNPERRPVKSF